MSLKVNKILWIGRTDGLVRTELEALGFSVDTMDYTEPAMIPSHRTNADVVVLSAEADQDAIGFFTGLDEEFPNDDRLHVMIADRHVIDGNLIRLYVTQRVDEWFMTGTPCGVIGEHLRSSLDFRRQERPKDELYRELLNDIH